MLKLLHDLSLSRPMYLSRDTIIHFTCIPSFVWDNITCVRSTQFYHRRLPLNGLKVMYAPRGECGAAAEIGYNNNKDYRSKRSSDSRECDYILHYNVIINRATANS